MTDGFYFSLFFTQSVYNSMISKDLHDLGLSTYIFEDLYLYKQKNVLINVHGDFLLKTLGKWINKL